VRCGGVCAPDAYSCRWQRRAVPLPEHVGPGRQPEHEIGECDHERHRLRPAITAQPGERSSGGENDRREQPGYAPRGCVAQLPPGRPARQPGSGQADGNAGGYRGQVRIGTRCVRLADPVAELAAGQPARHERGLEHVDHPLAVGMRRPQLARSRSELPPFRLPLPLSRRLPWRRIRHQRSAAALWPTILRPSQHAYLSGFGERT
jgi:hypothetical protein